MGFSSTVVAAGLLFAASVIAGDVRASDLVGDCRWSETAELHPTCIVQPSSADVLSGFVKTLVQGECPFAIKSGGHNPWAGVNDIDEGVVVDLSKINEVSLSYDRTSVKLGAGGNWGDVYKALEPQGMMVPGARASGVGVGGMTLGGGLSYFTPRVGLTADNVVDFEVVLASGEVVHATDSDNTDLFYSLKGGSSNFGIVTRMDVKAFQNGEIWGGEIVSPINATEDALHHLNDFVTNSNTDVNTAVEVVFNLNTTNGEQRIISIVADTAGNADSSLLKPFQSLPKVADTSRKTSMSDLSEELQGRLPAGQRYAFATVTFQSDLDALKQVHNISLAVFEDYKDVKDVTWNLVYESLPLDYQNFGPNPIGLNYSTTDRIALVLNPTWLDATQDDQVAKAANDWVDRIQEWTNVHGKSSPLELLPYAAPFQDPLEFYGDDNLKFLQEVAKKYDPDEAFQKLVPGGFKVSKAGRQ
ncbi:hypothetical protein M409DRAFT_66307 [Zasmidium cellare ATCC 36951]|uniref:FAD-binding PCMH-type domain-containing protein n=1 Tax=Zasmidium cellare ATCC 36951 TaxID=1080233 RepID=A0A6A6CN22_ZASCE|nr:uncharacterized protein M409DRAFT_66307 [Zasmidium cellare ATCC 36951]KAF2167312.1 hypothetical protein M409DRAFT_66307 [Zasmidium cellare ATCC 36951]